jgi:hypothetical protein
MAAKRRRNAEQRRALVEEFRRGGLGRHAFCRLHGIGSSTFDAWMREFASPGAFLPVRIEPEVATVSIPGGPAARIIGARGFALEFASGADAAWVAAVCGRLL